MEIKSIHSLPTKVSAGSARSCYSTKLKLPEDITDSHKKINLLKDLLKSGHHTTLQHTTFTISIKGMSRLLIWRLLHSHSFYNSDQVSQRYTKVSPDKTSYFFPTSINKQKSTDYFNTLYYYYEELSKKLEEIYLTDKNPITKKNAKKHARELARYVLPQATTAHLYHTVSLLTALRYIKACEIIPEAKNEAKLFQKELEDLLTKEDPDLKDLIDIVKKDKTVYIDPSFENFPDIPNGKNSTVFGVSSISDGHYKNTNLNLGTIFHNTEGLSTFIVRMRLSLSADAQNERHRTSFGLRKSLADTIPNHFYVPPIIKENKDILKIYSEAILYSSNWIKKYRTEIKKDEIPYFFLNAMQIEIIERNDAENFTHKAILRTCLNAQEEILNITEEIVEELQKAQFPLSNNMVPPCVIRNRKGIKPICSEGPRFCGIKVWKDKKYNAKR